MQRQDRSVEHTGNEKMFFSLFIDMLTGHLSKHPNIQSAIVFCETF